MWVCEEAEDGVGSLGTGVTEGYGLTSVGAGSQAWGLYKSSQCLLTTKPSLQCPVASS